MKRVKDEISILNAGFRQQDGPITWGLLMQAVAGLEILETDIVEVGQDYTNYSDGDNQPDGFSISIIRNVYETDEEERIRMIKELEGKMAYQKILADRAADQHKQALAEHERLSKLFNPIPKS